MTDPRTLRDQENAANENYYWWLLERDETAHHYSAALGGAKTWDALSDSQRELLEDLIASRRGSAVAA